jgi:hypothetical protein
MLYFDRGKTLELEKFKFFPIFWDKIRFFSKQKLGQKLIFWEKIRFLGKIRLFFLKKFGKKSDFRLLDRFFSSVFSLGQNHENKTVL